MTESVRLVIWDLDDTYWKGTLSEGGIESYIIENHNIVIELAKRGIMNSICSKNDFSRAIQILDEKDISKFFIYPSISWGSKASRIAHIIESVKLRPASVMFIDDNPSNRAEARSLLPDLQVESEDFLLGILEDPRFKGKDDLSLSRLAQYKLLESKAQTLNFETGDPYEFLRNSNIRVFIDYDVENNIERAIELINRTNQLNYTKMRLPDDIADAIDSLRKLMRRFDVQAGLIKVRDNYGDYGYVGFFLLVNNRRESESGSANRRLVHFCFSCRTLGMFVEQWVYNHLGKPELQVVGEVSSELDSELHVDWVQEVKILGETEVLQTAIAPKVVLWGGCEANAISVYASSHSNNVETFANFATNNFLFKIDSVEHVMSICRTASEFAELEGRKLGVPVEMLSNNFFERHETGTIYVFCFGLDGVQAGHMRHKTTGMTLNMFPKSLNWSGHLLNGSHEEFMIAVMNNAEEKYSEYSAEMLALSTHLRKNYEAVATSQSNKILRLKNLIETLPAGSRCIILLHSSLERTGIDTWQENIPRAKWSNLVKALLLDYKFAAAIDFQDIIADKREMMLGRTTHYQRQVYWRMTERIVEVSSLLEDKLIR